MSAPPQRTHYQVLGIPESASADEVRRAHRQLAQVLHPDRQAGASAAEQSLAERRMREVNAAWTALSDPQRRAAYDRSLRAARTGSASAGASATATATAARGPMAARFVDDEPEFDRSVDVDPDEPELSPTHFWLLRRGPLVAALVIGALVFVVSAYAGGDQQAPRHHLHHRLSLCCGRRQQLCASTPSRHIDGQGRARGAVERWLAPNAGHLQPLVVIMVLLLVTS